MTLSNNSLTPGLHANLFQTEQALQEGFQITQEGEKLILKKNSIEIIFGKKMANKAGEGFILTAKFYKSTNYAAILYLENWKLEERE